jgi:hypothetical protein
MSGDTFHLLSRLDPSIAVIHHRVIIINTTTSLPTALRPTYDPYPLTSLLGNRQPLSSDLIPSIKTAYVSGTPSRPVDYSGIRQAVFCLLRPRASRVSSLTFATILDYQWSSSYHTLHHLFYARRLQRHVFQDYLANTYT